MFWTRLASGITLLIIAIIVLFLGGLPLGLMLLFCSLIAYRELTKALLCATDDKKLNALEIIGLFGVGAYYALMFFSEDKIWLFLCIVMVFMAQMFWYVITFPKYQAGQVAAAVFSFLYAPVMLSFVYLTRQMGSGRYEGIGFYVGWLILISSWGCDTCAYAVGVLIGKHKIFPLLSPKKSLEGCIGGAAGAALIGALYGYFVVEKAYAAAGTEDFKAVGAMAFICAMGAVMSMVGDLAASAIKRNHNIKDYGNLIPGHGGIMDRFDSMTVTAPMIYCLVTLVLLR